MPLAIKNLHTVDTESFPYIFERDVDIPLRTALSNIPNDPLLVRANVYRPKADGNYPVLCTYGPYGKDIPYEAFHSASFADVNPKHKSVHSAWETPDPAFWTANGYAIVRADERGAGNSPGKLDSMSKATGDGFFDVVEWAADQPWSSGKVGLLGISYYAGTQWRVAARKPKGLAAIVPWEGMSDYYRDRVRQGGILSNRFIQWWYDRQVSSNQYGLGGRTERNWGTDSLEGVLTEEELKMNRVDQGEDTAKHKFRDEEYYRSKDFDLADIDIPVLSAANWGGIHLHLRGNVMGYIGVSSKCKYLRFLTGRHDIPFYYDVEAAEQKSFLDAFLKGEDDRGWSVPGKVAPVDLCLRKGNPGYNDAPAELRAFPRRKELEWPIARTIYTKYHLTASKTMTTASGVGDAVLAYKAPKGELTFCSAPFIEETEITGHPVLRLSLALKGLDGSTPSELDVFVTLRHYDAEDRESAVGDPCPLVRGWLRLSLRALSKTKSVLSDIIPVRDYLSSDVQPVELGKIYTEDIEIWPTNVVMLPGETIALQISSCDTEGVSLFEHNHPEDRSEAKLKGWNEVHIGSGFENYLTLPIIPQQHAAVPNGH